MTLETLRKEALEKFILQHNLKRGAEIGVWQGETSSHILKNTDCFLYLVDLWSSSAKYKKWNQEKNKRITLKRIKKSQNSKILQGVRWDVAQQIQDQELDFVFIDGDHSTEGVRNDIQAYTPKIKQGGYIMGHDWDWQSVKTAVLEFCVEPQLLTNGIWYYKKGEEIESTRKNR